MTSPLSPAVLLKALDGLAMRAEATAQNIANAGTPDYRPVRVSFEQALVEATTHGSSAVKAVTPRMTTDASDDAGSLRLDLELADAASTAGRYVSLIEMLNRQLQIQSLVLVGGR